MSSTPAQKFVCPRCRASFDEPSRFCTDCGTDMTRASPLEAAQRAEESAGEPNGRGLEAIDRRLSDSNRTWLGKVVDGRYRVLEVIGEKGEKFWIRINPNIDDIMQDLEHEVEDENAIKLAFNPKLGEYEAIRRADDAADRRAAAGSRPAGTLAYLGVDDAERRVYAS